MDRPSNRLGYRFRVESPRPVKAMPRKTRTSGRPVLGAAPRVDGSVLGAATALGAAAGAAGATGAGAAAGADGAAVAPGAAVGAAGATGAGAAAGADGATGAGAAVGADGATGAGAAVAAAGAAPALSWEKAAAGFVAWEGIAANAWPVEVNAPPVAVVWQTVQGCPVAAV